MIIFVYIGISSTFVINENSYKKLAGELANHNEPIMDKAIINWETANVSLTNEKKSSINVAPTSSSKFNNFLLFLNGRHFISVELDNPTQNFGIGTIIFYFNPLSQK